jgi:hypothetical protein
VSGVACFIAPQYIIHSDPGDPSDGHTLNHARFSERLATSRMPVSDLIFTIERLLDGGGCVVVSWVMAGTHRAFLGGISRLRDGRTASRVWTNDFAGGMLTGHTQVADRLAVLGQLWMLG